MNKISQLINFMPNTIGHVMRRQGSVTSFRASPFMQTDTMTQFLNQSGGIDMTTVSTVTNRPTMRCTSQLYSCSWCILLACPPSPCGSFIRIGLDCTANSTLLLPNVSRRYQARTQLSNCRGGMGIGAHSISWFVITDLAFSSSKLSTLFASLR